MSDAFLNAESSARIQPHRIAIRREVVACVIIHRTSTDDVVYSAISVRVHDRTDVFADFVNVDFRSAGEVQCPVTVSVQVVFVVMEQCSSDAVERVASELGSCLWQCCHVSDAQTSAKSIIAYT